MADARPEQERVVRDSGTHTSTAFVTATAKASSNMWIKWALIAMDHERTARVARSEAERVTDPQKLGDPFEAEFHASLVALTASAFALEAFANHLDEWLGASVPKTVGQQYGGRVPAAVRVIQVLKDSFDIGPNEPRWTAEVRALFDLRNDVVHFKPAWNELVKHPTGKSDVVLETVIYSLERASRSVALAVEIMATCLGSPRRDRSQVVEWAEGIPHIAPWLLERHKAVCES
jgi:hypothetical protein